MAEVHKDVLKSSLLERELPFRVILPEEVENQDRPGVLYLLHGLFGSCDNWIELTRLRDVAKSRTYIIVMPEAEDGWYVDSETRGQFESVYLDELVPFIDERFRTSGARGIAGNSMGGYGAIKFAFRRPELFRFAISCSGAFHAPQIFEEIEGFDELKESVLRVFGPAGSSERRSNDIGLQAGAASNTEIVPHLYLDCGVHDSFVQINREMSDLLKRNGIAHTYNEFEGGHGWDYWDARLESILAIADEHLN